MQRKAKTQKVVATVTNDLKEWIEQYSIQSSLPQAAIVILALNQLRAQQ